MIYTSGSTGKPKGVRFRIVAIVNWLFGCRTLIRFGTTDAVGGRRCFALMFVWELFLPLMTGGSC